MALSCQTPATARADDYKPLGLTSLVQAMTGTLYPMFDPGNFYGLGAMVVDAPDGDRRLLWIGNAGGTPGAGALVVYATDDHAFAAVALTGDGWAVASVNALLKAMRQPSTHTKE